MLFLNSMPKMVRVINNLLSNALNTATKDSVITMEVLNGGGVTFTVQAWDQFRKVLSSSFLILNMKHPF